MAKRKGKGKGKGKTSRESKKASKILVQTFTGEDGTEFYSIDMETEKVMKLPMETLGKEAIMTSLVPFGSFIYLFGFDQTRRSPHLYKIENEKLNESGFVHTGVSYIEDISSNKEKEGEEEGKVANAKWKAGPPPPVKPPHMWFPESCLLSGKIYVFTCKANKAQVFDPKLNQWTLLSPPRGQNNFDIDKPVLPDHSNDRLLVFFLRSRSRSGSCSVSLYAYYPTAPPLARWDLLLPEFDPPSLMAVESGVIFSYDPNKSTNRVFTAFDVDSKETLHIKFTSNLDQKLWFIQSNFSALLNLGNRILCLLAPALNDSCTPNETLVFAIQFKIHRISPLDVLITPFPGKSYSLRDLRHPIAYYAF